MVFQSYALYPHMSVAGNMGFALRMMKVDPAGIERRVREAAETLGITELLDRRPWQLSGGQRQRVALGRAIVREPAVFLMDEPLSNLDVALRVSTRGELKRLHQELGRTFVYVTHDQAEALALSDLVAVMDRGRLQQLGSPDEIYERPANTFVAAFVGSPAMNLLRGRILLEDGDRLLRGACLPVAAGGGARGPGQGGDPRSPPGGPAHRGAGPRERMGRNRPPQGAERPGRVPHRTRLGHRPRCPHGPRRIRGVRKPGLVASPSRPPSPLRRRHRGADRRRRSGTALSLSQRLKSYSISSSVPCQTIPLCPRRRASLTMRSITSRGQPSPWMIG